MREAIARAQHIPERVNFHVDEFGMIKRHKRKIESAGEQELAEENRSLIDFRIVQAPEQRRDKSYEHDDDFKCPYRQIGEEAFPKAEEKQDVYKK